jgi:putative oxygen-independent coproporphyrinogen III oxidase
VEHTTARCDVPFELVTASAASKPLGMYVHVPFCVRRCGYCAFTTFTVGELGDPGAQDRYVRAAEAELSIADAILGPDRPPLSSIYFGGGTPTMLLDQQFGRVLAAVRERFDVLAEAEVTVEANPDGLRAGQLDALRGTGVTRLSLGMQSTSPQVLRTLDRTHDPELALRAVADATAAGIDHVSLDLIYGTPGERPSDWEATLHSATRSGVDHVSAYALGIEAGTKLAARVRAGSLAAPAEDEAADRYLVAEQILAAAGFEWYEISNWARSPGARSRHNQLYWRNHHWWGVGPGAHSHVGGVRWWNTGDLAAWERALTGGRPAVAGSEVPGPTERRTEAIMLGLRTAEGLPAGEIPDGRAVRALVGDGLLDRVGDHLVLTLQGRLLADHVVRGLM